MAGALAGDGQGYFPLWAAGVYYLYDVIEPAAPRDYILQALGICQDHQGGLSEHRLANWPTKF